MDITVVVQWTDSVHFLLKGKKKTKKTPKFSSGSVDFIRPIKVSEHNSRKWAKTKMFCAFCALYRCIICGKRKSIQKLAGKRLAGKLAFHPPQTVPPIWSTSSTWLMEFNSNSNQMCTAVPSNAKHASKFIIIYIITIIYYVIVIFKLLFILLSYYYSYHYCYYIDIYLLFILSLVLNWYFNYHWYYWHYIMSYIVSVNIITDVYYLLSHFAWNW